MHRIDGPGATVENKFTDGDPVGGVQATLVTDDWLNDVQEELMSVLAAGGVTPVKGTQNQVLQAIRSLSAGAIGSARNVKMSVATASASATLTADQIIVGASLSGQAYRLASFNKTINLSTTGVGGMDTGTVPVSGFVAIYAIYNPTTGVSALLAVNATSVVAPEVYGGANMPAGYTASALVSVWRTASSQFVIGNQRDRSISFPFAVAANSATAVATLTAFSLSSIVSFNAVACGGFMTVSGTNTTNAITILASTAAGVGQVQAAGNSTTGGVQNISGGPFSAMKIITAQTLYWQTQAASGTFGGGGIYLSSYDF